MSAVASVRDQIQKLKKERQALILAHYYEESEVQDLADFVGDSLALAEQGQKSSAAVILLAGVVFMAETVKILSPKKTVLVPDLNAGCSLVEGSPAAKYRAWKESFPDSVLVSYVNSSAEVKALSDVIVTSSNAERIIRAIPEEKQILFGPDRQLGKYLSQILKRPFELWPGACEVHILFSARQLFELRSRHPAARVLAHPECADEVLAQADVIGSTSRLLEEVRGNLSCQEFIVATEPGILHQMKKARPEAVLIEAPNEKGCACNNCPYMKLNTLEKIELALRDLKPEIQVDPELSTRARLPLDRMMKITRGEIVDWTATGTQHFRSPPAP